MDLSAFNIAFAPLLPLEWLAGLGAAAAVLATLTIRGARRGVWVRAAALAILFSTLANPTLLHEKRDDLSDIGLIVYDETASQTVGDRPRQIALARDYFSEAIEDRDRLEIRTVTINSRPGRGSDPDGSNLIAAMRGALTDIPRPRLAGAIVVTDGQAHDLPENPASLDIEAPIHFLVTGRPDERDRRLKIVRAPTFGLVGRTLELTLRVEDLISDSDIQSGGGLARVSLRQDGDLVQEALTPVGEDRSLSFTLKNAGQTVLEIEVETGPGELTEVNNRAVVSVNGVRDRLRVLLVSGEPHSGERTWRNLLKSDPSVDLVHFTILRPPEKQDGTPIDQLSLIAFPIRELFEVKLDEFDLVIFDRYRRRGVLPSHYLRNIAEYVRDGGALLEAAGPQFASPLTLYRTPLGQVLPGEPTGEVMETAFRPRVTPLGHRHPVTSGLPGANPPATDGDARTADPTWGRWFRQIEVAARDGVTPMTGADGQPLLILRRIGEGRVAQILSDQIWLWDRGFEGGGPQAELLRRIAHWLMKEPDLEEESLLAQAVGDRIEVERRSLDADPGSVSVISPSGKRAELRLERVVGGRSAASMKVEELGLYTVTDGRLASLAAVGPLNPKEFADLRSSPTKLRPVAEATKGSVRRISGRSEAIGLPDIRRPVEGRAMSGAGWIGLRRNEVSIVRGLTEIPLLPALLVLFLAIGALMLTWRREGRADENIVRPELR